MKIIRPLALIVLVLGIIGIVLGGVFIGEGLAKNNLIVDRMKVEKVSLALDPNNPQQLTPVTSSASAQAAADKIAADRRAIAPTYQDLLNMTNGRFDPTNDKELSYAQAMNLENYLYLAVTAFGLTQSVMGTGVYMFITGLAVFLIGFLVFKIAGRLNIAT
ncbi:MAG TPA: hypothetical protein VMB24_01100 [Dehalococcoidales bacterium]|nr:hypothetical protein [Dehalococcoidales bacterium]